MFGQKIEKDREDHNSNSFTSTPSLPFDIFDKYKTPTPPVASAFRLFSHNDDSSSSESASSRGTTRRNRGTYRKYTLAEKEEAVRKVHADLYRYSRDPT
jgi:hypothetical protein